MVYFFSDNFNLNVELFIRADDVRMPYTFIYILYMLHHAFGIPFLSFFNEGGIERSRKSSKWKFHDQYLQTIYGIYSILPALTDINVISLICQYAAFLS